jgi:hypothetical protein
VEGVRLAGRPVRIFSLGTGEGGGRLDRFELAAARAAAVGRALREGEQRRPYRPNRLVACLGPFACSACVGHSLSWFTSSLRAERSNPVRRSPLWIASSLRSSQ